MKHEIKLLETLPIKQRYQPRNTIMQEMIMEKAVEMLKEEVIQPSNSAWSSPVVLARKKNGEWRFCIDYRR